MTRSPRPLDRGDLASSPLAAVLLQALRASASGVLEIVVGGKTSRIYFREGHPAAIQALVGFQPFGLFLFDLGWIDIEGLERSLAGVVAGKRQGQVLVELGLLPPERVRDGLELHQRAQLKTLSELEEGTYRFVPGTELPEWAPGLQMPAYRAIVDAMTALPGQRLARQILSRLPAGHGLKLRADWERPAARFRLDRWEQQFVEGLVQPQPLDCAVAAARVPPERARAIAACFLYMGLAKAQPPTAETGASDPSAGPGQPLAGEPAKATPPKGLAQSVSLQDTDSPAGSTSERWRRLQTAQEREQAEFERARKAEEEENRRLKAEREEAQRRAREAVLSQPVPEFKSDAAETRARRSKLLRRAFRNIPGAPEALRSSRAARQPGPSVSGDPRTVALRAIDRPRPMSGSAPSSSDRSATDLETRIRDRHARIAGEDHFQRLGIPRSANRAEVKRAFIDAAKIFHPDKLPSGLAHLSREVKELFSAIHEAYDVLEDDDQRRTYEARLDGGEVPRTIDERIRGLVAFAEYSLLQRDFREAEVAYRQAAALKVRPDLLAHAAWAVISDPSRRAEAPKARAELAALAENHATTAAPHYYLGLIARLDGDLDRAERHFRDALEANPKHAESALELRLLSAKDGKGNGRR